MVAMFVAILCTAFVILLTVLAVMLLRILRPLFMPVYHRLGARTPSRCIHMRTCVSIAGVCKRSGLRSLSTTTHSSTPMLRIHVRRQHDLCPTSFGGNCQQKTSSRSTILRIWRIRLWKPSLRRGLFGRNWQQSILRIQYKPLVVGAALASPQAFLFAES